MSITLDVYSHVLPGLQEDAAAKIDAALKSGLKQQPRSLVGNSDISRSWLAIPNPENVGGRAWESNPPGTLYAPHRI